jgi:peroxiredoxin
VSDRPAGGVGDRPAGGVGDRPAGGVGDPPAGGVGDPPAGGVSDPRPAIAVEPRRYGWIVGILAVILVVAFVIYTLTSRQAATVGIPAGQPLRFFAAPLAASTLNGDANVKPPCTLARHDPRALNVCLLAERGPLVLGFFVTDSSVCRRAVDTMQVLAARTSTRGAQFAAVAVDASHSVTASVVRARHWTIPVAYDADGAVGALYSVTACPLLELAARGGTVVERLIGNHWLQTTALGAQVQALLRR